MKGNYSFQQWAANCIDAATREKHGGSTLEPDMRDWISLAAALLAAALPACAAEARPHACEVAGVAGEALCATLPVWENRDAKSGRRIDLNIVILPALSNDHAPDPLFLLHGGPGAAATDLAPSFARHPVRERRDIVMIDQRGTGGSNPLQCNFFGDPPDLQRLVTSEFPVDQVRACRQRLEKIADLTQYTTAIAMDDIDEARRWLGYGKIDLWGGSYGSMAAQVYLRRHEAGVRAVVLEGVAPVDELIPLHHAAAGQRAIAILFDKCRAEPQCNTAYPHLREDFAAMFQRVRDGAEVTVHDRLGRSARVRPGVEALAEGIRHRLYGDTGNALAGMIHRAAAGDLAPIVQAAVDAEIALDSQLAEGLLLSVSCAEQLPYITDAMAARETSGTFLGDLRIRDQQAACAQWVRAPVPPDVHTLVRSNVPVLLISGYRDPVTQPSFAERVAQQLPNSRHLVFPEASHGGTGACGRDLIARFIGRGSAQGLDVSCVTARAASLPMASGAALAALVALVVWVQRRRSKTGTL
jgi:pimeloyl-ACP methyl ester carboxylesterase